MLWPYANARHRRVDVARRQLPPVALQNHGERHLGLNHGETLPDAEPWPSAEREESCAAAAALTIHRRPPRNAIGKPLRLEEMDVIAPDVAVMVDDGG